MNEQRRMLHPIYVLHGLFSVLRGFLPVIVIALLRGPDWSQLLKWYWIAGVSGAVVLILVLSYLNWRRFGYWLESDRIIIRSGLMFRDEKTIYYSRIHSVNVEQPLFHRLLGVAQLKIETPGGSKTSDGILHVLSKQDAASIQQLLRGQARAAHEGEPAQHTNDDAVRADIPVAQEANVVAAESVSADASASERAFAADNSRQPADRDHVPSAGESTLRLDAGQLLGAAATSFNIGLVAAFVGGLYSFADDFLELLLPEHFFENALEDTVSLMPSTLLIVVVTVIIIGFAWLLSLVLYIIKYSGFTVKKAGERISISYGLLEKKTYQFEPKKVQAIILDEGLVRQPFGYTEVKLQIVSSNNEERLMLHPFIKKKEVAELLKQFLPDMTLPQLDGMTVAPRRSLIYYMRFPLLFAAAACAGSIAYFGWPAVWSLLLLPLVAWWRVCCHRAAGMMLKDGQLTLRRRVINRTTYFTRRPRIVVMKVKRTRGQRRNGVISLSVHALGSSLGYGVACLNQKDVEPVWRWYSRNGAGIE
ncbi:PH domain-containing protein [Paenibacillus sp. J5C_2022]|uniref:PH domain-containing protein n=1 Tax=Paenibacillus sp. J5C2022 TaxID=2977129 RepID=UPI0021CFE972|nr:PH domain-containing protein [Paenibacillus sp. J5C2022]MCU6712520.1 PH domain-containing protein [Paenibacillus sp. J5C2022]